jgi:hypothetical protein
VLSFNFLENQTTPPTPRATPIPIPSSALSDHSAPNSDESNHEVTLDEGEETPDEEEIGENMVEEDNEDGVEERMTNF